jgi:hypothetical protein
MNNKKATLLGVVLLMTVSLVLQFGCATESKTNSNAWLPTEYPAGRTATLVVAASDSSDESKAQADYLCDGIADNVEMQAAIDALPTAGGCIQLSEGTFYITSAISITNDCIVLRGLGRRVTTLEKAANCDVISISSPTDEILVGIEIADLHIIGQKTSYTGNGITIAAFHYSTIRNLYIHQCAGDAISCSNSGTRRGTGCMFADLEIGECDGSGIVFNTAPFESYIRHCRIRNVGTYQIQLVGSPRNHIDNCHLGGTNGGNAILKMEGDLDGCIITGTWFSAMSNDTHGIHIDAVDKSSVQIAITGCNFRGKGKTTATHDGVFLDVSDTGTLYFTCIVGNTFNQWQYGVNINDPSVIKTLVEANIISNNRMNTPRDEGSNSLVVDNLTS